MAKSFIDIVQDSPRTGLGIPLITEKPPLEPIHRARNRISALNFSGGWFQLKVAYDTMCPSPGLVTMPSRLPFLDESAPSILADGLLRASDFLRVC